ncbi:MULTISPECIES: response regulator transcription factor [unclassified Streptomyces]|uniref:response regulator transcription factor n=1 Tax=unclassified Streptomyces TaxID=2593676 RepID=UPI0015EB5C95|nr:MULTISPECIES: response regulator transcription factor [unclassified Streptomyces]
MRAALADRLAREHDLEVHHTPWRGASRRASALRPHICVADLDCEENYGMPPLGDLHTGGPGRALLVLATAGRPGLLRRAAEANALGFVDKAGPVEQLLTGIRQVAEGRRYVDESLGFGFLQAAQSPLTRREFSVLSLAAEGASVAEIARSLHLSNGTVRNYMAAITRKVGARNRVDAIRISQGAGWL